MSEIVSFSPSEVEPDRDAVLENQGIPPGTLVRPDIECVYSAAMALLAKTAAPVGVLAEISQLDFAGVYEGEGRNEPSTPVGDILDQAEHLALFAVTIGEATSREIEARFKADDFALGCMLDAAASAAADKAACLVERRFAAALVGRGWDASSGGALRYSPGYCGWHISGQRRLFEYLHPERVGLTLRESYLMEPLKSVSGVILAGPRDMHDFAASYGFCSECETAGCRDRIRALFAG